MQGDSHAPTLSYRPSAWYFRKAIRSARTKAELKEIALQCVRELEAQKEFTRSLGLIPPRQFILSTEAEDKGLIQFPLPDES